METPVETPREAPRDLRLEPTLGPLCAQRPRLLRPEVVPLRGRPVERQVAELVLSFDAGPLWIRPASDRPELVCTLGAPSPDVETQIADEEEPWWRVMGAPLVAAWAVTDPSEGPAQVALQFREDSANPRIVSITYRSPGLALRCEPKPAWRERLAPVSARDARPDPERGARGEREP